VSQNQYMEQQPSHDRTLGPIVLSFIGVVILIIVLLYFWGQKLHKDSTLTEMNVYINLESKK